MCFYYIIKADLWLDLNQSICVNTLKYLHNISSVLLGVNLSALITFILIVSECPLVRWNIEDKPFTHLSFNPDASICPRLVNVSATLLGDDVRIGPICACERVWR